MRQAITKKILTVFILLTPLFYFILPGSTFAEEISPNQQAIKACGDKGLVKGDTGFIECWTTEYNKIGNTLYAEKGLFDYLGEIAEKFSSISSALGSIGNLVMNGVATIFAGISIPVLGALTRISAWLLDISIKSTLETGKITVLNDQIGVVWSTVRNVLNISFIFALLFVSIKTILGSSNVDTKKTISSVIIAALLINFSLFFTKIFIDAGNLLAVNLYNLITTNGTHSPGSLIFNWGTYSSMWKSLEGAEVFGSGFWINVITVNIFMWMCIGTFLYVAGLFFVRTTVLIFLMAVSPIGFMGSVLPQISEYSKMWRENLYGQIAIAPIFLLFFYLISLIYRAFDVVFTTNDVDAKLQPYFQYVFLIIMLIVATKITKKMAGEVGKVVEKVGKAALIATAAAVTGGAAIAIAGRAAAGRVASGLITGKISEETGAVGIAGRFARTKFMDSVKSGTYGTVDVDKWQKDAAKFKKDEQERIKRRADALGPAAAEARQTQLTNIETNHNNQVNQVLEDDTSSEYHITKDFKEAIKKQTEATKEQTETEEALKLANEKLASAKPEDKRDLERAAHEAEEARRLATEKATAAAETAKKASEKFDERRKKVSDEIAGKSGYDQTEIDKEKVIAKKKIAEGIKAKNEYVGGLMKKGELGSRISGMSVDEMKKLADEVRAHTGKYKNKESELRKMLKDYLDDEGKPKAPEGDKKTT
jgi:hypothetical protein